MRRLIAALAALAFSTTAFAQGVPMQGGAWTPGHSPMYVGSGSTQPVVQDSGPAAGGGPGLGLAEQLLVARPQNGGFGATAPFVNAGTGPLGTNWCDYDGPTTGPYHYLCIGPNSNGNPTIAIGAGGGATAVPLMVNFGGVNYSIPFNTAITGSVVGGDLTGTLPNPTVTPGAITGSKIALGTVTGSNIATGTVTGSNIASASVLGGNIAAGTVSGTNLSTGAAVANIGYQPLNRNGDTATGPIFLPANPCTDNSLRATTTSAAWLCGQPVTPQMYGAGGAGVTDDTAAVSSWLNSGRPLACSGTFNISSLVTVINVDVYLRGSSGYGPGCKLNLTTAQSMFYVVNANTNRVFIRDIKIIPMAAITAVTGPARTAALFINTPGGGLNGGPDPSVDIEGLSVYPDAPGHYVQAGLSLFNTNVTHLDNIMVLGDSSGIQGGYTTTTTAATSSSANVSVASASAVSPGENVTGTGVPGGATVSSVSGNILTLSAAATIASGATLTFTHGGAQGIVYDTNNQGTNVTATRLFGANLYQGFYSPLEATKGPQGIRIDKFDCVSCAIMVQLLGSQDGSSDYVDISGLEGAFDVAAVIVQDYSHVKIHDNYVFMYNLTGVATANPAFCYNYAWTVNTSHTPYLSEYGNSCDGNQIAVNTTAVGSTSSSTTVTVASAVGVGPGQGITINGTPVGQTVVSVSGNVVTLSAAATISNGSTLSFSNIRIGTNIGGLSNTPMGSVIGTNTLQGIDQGVALQSGTAGVLVYPQVGTGIGTAVKNSATAGQNSQVGASSL